MIYLLDTNTLSDLSSNPQGRVKQNIERCGMENVVTSVIVAGEVEFGLEWKQSKKLRGNMDAILRSIRVMPLEEAVWRRYGWLRADLKKKGTPIGPNDLWIASHALTLDAVMVTANVREFSRVPGLKVENWLR
ncbi:type II toxin-antitoxin system VapC family toxin [Rhizobium metallidurans]|uniref:tRNA(fMet)-specific endonuclease VapC n=1 Tax=Rhizobium metallidurans TaxID=1265931 RepID=A0A7W6CPD2_9HYPH|nr:type II toxin-antitoxin system VapC family toxin [Rhizobium metallidurans]MBB3964755.1 tRNA(fMet)-specific endonuclease VapC [Rhizobium metallidurans]